MIITKTGTVVVSSVEGVSCDWGRAYISFQGAGNILLFDLSNDYVQLTL